MRIKQILDMLLWSGSSRKIFHSHAEQVYIYLKTKQYKQVF